MTTSNIKTLVRGAYDVQKLRIQMGNRIVVNFKAKLGQPPGRPESEIDPEGKELLRTLRQHFRKITDGVTVLPRQDRFKGDEIISTYTELCLVSQYLDLESHEEKHFRHLEKVLREYPIYTNFLKNVKGIGPAMAGVIVSEIDIYKAEYPSSLWRYAGLDVGHDGAGRSRRAEHLIETIYISKDGELKWKRGITFNPFLKTKLIGVLGPSFLRAGDNPYRRIYDDYKHRLLHSPAHQDKSKGHIHNMAIRYMIKRFLVNLYKVWRRLEGLPVADEYSQEKLRIVHRKAS